MTPVRIAIVGSRRLPQERARAIIFGGVAGTPEDAVIVSGGARGPVGSKTTVSADREAARAARFYRRTLDEYPVTAAEWNTLGMRAGPERNQRIVDSLSGPEDRMVCLWDGVSAGTRDVGQRAEWAGVRVRVVVVRG